jgi:hypothetical protein
MPSEIALKGRPACVGIPSKEPKGGIAGSKKSAQVIASCFVTTLCTLKKMVEQRRH